ncbi:Transcription elongation factor SPT5 [Aphelenchoides fujianensis]|nr:Transcription elongation factor SPT5 [Aphelenchoides fujianensis]
MDSTTEIPVEEDKKNIRLIHRPAVASAAAPAAPAEATAEPAATPVVVPAAPKIEPVEPPVEQPVEPVPPVAVAEPVAAPVAEQAEPTRKRREWHTDGEEEEEVERKPPVKKSKKSAPKKAATKRPKSTRTQRRPANPFIADDVEVDDEDEDDGEWIDEGAGLSAAERREVERALRQQQNAPPPPARRNPLFDLDEEQMAAYFEQRHAEERENRATGTDAFDGELQQNALQPTTKDPSLWIVRVREGQERAITLQLLRKCIAFGNKGEPLNIKSVVCKENLKGRLYVEARSKDDVARLIQGIMTIRMDIQRVPIDQMVDTLKVVKKTPNLKADDYVRVTRTMYKGDLAQVDWVDVAQNQVCLRLLPRIDYKKKRAAKQESQSEDEDTKDVELAIFKQALGRKGAKSRALPAPFDAEKMRQLGAESTTDGDFVLCKGQRYRRGLLYKIFPLISVTDENIQPTLEELKNFQEKPSADPEFLEELAKTTIKADPNVFVVGDVVEVIEGELVNLRGAVQSVEKDGIVLLPDHADLKLRKFFKAGDHVRITGGKFARLTGSVVSVDGNVVVVVSDLNLDHMSVRLHDVRLDAHVSTGVDQLGRFHFHELVTLGENEVGVIVRLERDLVEILNQQGNLVRVKPNSIQPRGVRMAKAFDSAGNTIQRGDRVRLNDQSMRGFRDGDDERVAEIKYIYRNAVFLFSRMYALNSGIFVCRNKLLTLLGAPNAPPNTPANAAFVASAQSPRHAAGGVSGEPTAAPQPFAQSFASPQIGRTFGGSTRTPGRDTSIIGKTDATETTVRVELYAQPKTISVHRSRVDIVGAASSSTSARPSAAAFGAESRTSSVADRAGRTPLYGAASQVPMYGAGAQTPAHDSIAGDRSSQFSDTWDPSNVAATPVRSVMHELEEDDGEAVEINSFGHSEAGQSSMNARTPSAGSHHDFSRSGDDSASFARPQSPPSTAPIAEAEAPDSFLRKGEWVVADLLVRVLPTCEDEEIRGMQGSVRDAAKDQNAVELYFEDLEFSAKGPDRRVPLTAVCPVQPEVGDRARALFGSAQGVSGVVREGEPGIVRLETDDGKTRSVPVRNLCKLY